MTTVLVDRDPTELHQLILTPRADKVSQNGSLSSDVKIKPKRNVVAFGMELKIIVKDNYMYI